MASLFVYVFVLLLGADSRSERYYDNQPINQSANRKTTKPPNRTLMKNFTNQARKSVTTSCDFA